MNFGEAFEQIARGPALGMKLEVWETKGDPNKVIRCQCPDEHSKMKHPYLYETGNFVTPWLPNMWELFSESWILTD